MFICTQINSEWISLSVVTAAEWLLLRPVRSRNAANKEGARKEIRRPAVNAASIHTEVAGKTEKKASDEKKRKHRGFT